MLPQYEWSNREEYGYAFTKAVYVTTLVSLTLYEGMTLNK